MPSESDQCPPNLGLDLDHAIPADPELVAQGWVRRYLADADRAKEAIEVYSSLGYEVKAQKLTPEDFGESCGACASAICHSYVMVYTRKPGATRHRSLQDDSVMTSPDDFQDDLVYHWNEVQRDPPAGRTVEFDDETLRDGLQSPTVVIPPVEDKIRILHLMSELGIDAVDIGLPAAGPQVLADVVALAKEIAEHKLPISPGCAARTLEADIRPIVDASQAAGIELGVSMFIGSSPIRKYAESWTLDNMARITERAVTFVVKHDLPATFVTEDTTRADPETLKRLCETAIDAGARRVCIADTVGYATPHGATMIVKFVKSIITGRGVDVKIDWHGHSDRGLGIANALAAAEAGADRVHGTGLGVGERTGNAPMEQLLVNFRLAGYIKNDLHKLSEYCELISETLHVPIPFNQPVVGRDAFRTCTGVHAAAVIKALRKGNAWLANRIYSSVPADWVGRCQRIEVGPMSGVSNVKYWLEEHNIEADDSLVDSILSTAKKCKTTMTSDEILQIVRTNK